MEKSVSEISYKCKTCRNYVDFTSISSPSSNECIAIHIDVDYMPGWMTNDIDNAMWMKGKIRCPSCSAKLGSFNFLDQSMVCRSCKQMSPVNISYSRVDKISTIPDIIHPSLCGEINQRCLLSDHSQTEGLELPVSQSVCTLENPASVESVRCSQESHAESEVDAFISSSLGAGNRFSYLYNDEETSLETKPTITSRVKKKRNRCKAKKGKLIRWESQDDLCAKENMVAENTDIDDSHICSVCMDVWKCPHRVIPCGHCFCEQCLLRMKRHSIGFHAATLACPLCRADIKRCEFDRELSKELARRYRHVQQRTPSGKQLPKAVDGTEYIGRRRNHHRQHNCIQRLTGYVLGLCIFTLGMLFLFIAVFRQRRR